MDTVQFSPGGEIISIRLARSELGTYNRKELLRQLNDDSVLFGSSMTCCLFFFCLINLRCK